MKTYEVKVGYVVKIQVNAQNKKEAKELGLFEYDQFQKDEADKNLFKVEVKEIKKDKRKLNIWNAEHPARKKAIYIMETVAGRIGKENIFDSKKKDDTRWFDIEDMITMVIAGKTKE